MIWWVLDYWQATNGGDQTKLYREKRELWLEASLDFTTKMSGQEEAETLCLSFSKVLGAGLPTFLLYNR